MRHRDDNLFQSTEKSGREVQNRLTEDTRYIEKVFTNVRQKVSRPEEDQMVLEQRVNVLKRGLFMSATMKAAIHLGENDKDNLFTFRNTDFEALKTLFDITQKLILEQKHEMQQVSTIEWQVTPWMRSTLPHDIVTRAKVHVYSDAVFCLGKMFSHPESVEKIEKSNSNISREQMNTKNSLESTENLLSRLEYYHSTHYSGHSRRDSDKDGNARIKA